MVTVMDLTATSIPVASRRGKTTYPVVSLPPSARPLWLLSPVRLPVPPLQQVTDSFELTMLSELAHCNGFCNGASAATDTATLTVVVPDDDRSLSGRCSSGASLSSNTGYHNRGIQRFSSMAPRAQVTNSIAGPAIRAAAPIPKSITLNGPHNVTADFSTVAVTARQHSPPGPAACRPPEPRLWDHDPDVPWLSVCRSSSARYH